MSIRASFAKGVHRGKRFASGMDHMFKRAAKAMRRAAGSSTMTNRSDEGPSSAITSQHDSKLLYRRRRAPRKVRRKFRRRAKRFLKNQLKAQSSSTNLFQKYTIEASLTNLQRLFSIVSGYTWCGQGASSNDQVGNIYEVLQNIEAADPAGIAKDWYLTGMSTDYTITNYGDNTVELDVYEFVYRKDIEYENAVCSTDQFIREANDEEGLLPGAGSKIATTSLGFVPTDANKAMRSILIKSKQRFYIGAGNVISFTKRTKFFRPVKYVSTDFKERGNASFDNILTAKAGVTRGLLCILKGVPTATQSADPSTVAYNAQTRYTVKQVDRINDRHASGT